MELTLKILTALLTGLKRSEWTARTLNDLWVVVTDKEVFSHGEKKIAEK
jgi:hypothetical protein